MKITNIFNEKTAKIKQGELYNYIKCPVFGVVIKKNFVIYDCPIKYKKEFFIGVKNLIFDKSKGNMDFSEKIIENLFYTGRIHLQVKKDNYEILQNRKGDD